MRAGLFLRRAFFAAIPLTAGAVLGLAILQGGGYLALALALGAPVAWWVVKRPFLGLLLWLWVMPFVSALPVASSVYWALQRVMAPGLAALALLPEFLKAENRRSVRLGVPEAALAALVTITPLSILLMPDDPQQSLIRFLDRFLIPALMYLAARLLPLDEREQKLLAWTAAFILLSQSLIGFISWTVPSLLPYSWRYMSGARATGSLLDPYVFTVFLLFAITYMVHADHTRLVAKGRMAFLALCSAGALAVLLSFQRGSWLTGVLAAAVVILFYPKTSLRLVPLTILVMTLFSTTVFSRQIALVEERMSEKQPVYDRMVVYDAMQQMIVQKPVLGWGYDQLNKNIARFYRPVGMAAIPAGRFVTSHNTFLTICTELGLAGLGLYLLPAVWYLARFWQVSRRRHRAGQGVDSLLLALWLGLGSFLLINNFEDMRFYPTGLTLGWMLLGWIANRTDALTSAGQPEQAAQTDLAAGPAPAGGAGWGLRSLFDENPAQRRF